MNDPKPLAHLDITQLIDDRALSRFQILVIALCGFIAMLDGFDTQAIAFVAPAIAVDIGADKSAFGPVFSAALVGLAVGAVSLGTLADSAGRRRVIIGCTVAFGLFSIATAYASSLNQIMVLRFLTGLGLGGAMPNIIALTTDYSPKTAPRGDGSNHVLGIPPRRFTGWGGEFSAGYIIRMAIYIYFWRVVPPALGAYLILVAARIANLSAKSQQCG